MEVPEENNLMFWRAALSRIESLDGDRMAAGIFFFLFFSKSDCML
jgi:hypothetical protein